MATDGDTARSGGKILRGRRIVDVSPYSRPTQNPNRLMRFISPASRLITGAAKMISTVFFPDTPPSSSSSSSGEDDSESEDVSSEGDDSLNQTAATSEGKVYAEKNFHFNVPQNEIKPAIEQLLMQETFSRDECNKLVKIIESRVVEFPAKKVGGNTDQHPGGHGIDIRNTSLLESKRWVEENNWDSHSQFDKSRGSFTSNPSNFTEGELGSPILMAKSYMKSRPPWTSPTAANIGYQTASPVGLYAWKEESLATAANALSPSKDLKRSPAVDTPDNLDGSRRVRFKISENNVRPLAACDNSQEDKTHVEAAKKDAELSSGSLSRKGVKQSTHLSVDSPKNNGFSASQGSGYLAFLLPSDHNQDLEGGQIKQERSKIHAAANIGLETQDDSQSQDDYPKQKETNSSSDRFGVDGFASAPSLSTRVNARSSPRKSGEEGVNVMATNGGNWEGSCELLSEFSVEVGRNEETNDATGPSIKSSKPSGDQMVTKNPSVSSPGMKRRSSSARVEKIVTKGPNPPSRRGRGRGRGRGK